MVDQPRVTLAFVITKIKTLAAKKYDNKIYDNVLAIYNSLTVTEKRVLLKGLINICFIVEREVIVDKTPFDEVKEELNRMDNHLFNEISNIEAYDQLELIKLKSWFIKFTLKLSLIVVGVIIAAGIFFSGDSKISENIGNYFTVWKTMFF